MSKITPETREKYESTPKQDTMDYIFQQAKDISTLGAFERPRDSVTDKAQRGEQLDGDKKRS